MNLQLSLNGLCLTQQILCNDYFSLEEMTTDPFAELEFGYLLTDMTLVMMLFSLYVAPDGFAAS